MTGAAPGEVAEVPSRPTDDVLDAPGLPLGPHATPATPVPADPARGWLRRFWFVPAGVALLGAAALVPSVGGSGPGAGEARLTVDGVARVTDADGGTTTVRDDRVDVGPGDRVEIIEGQGVFEMAGDVRLEGVGGSDGSDGTTVEMAVAPRLVAGSLLVDAPTPLEVEATAATLTVEPRGETEGVARLERGLGLTVGTYRGRVTVASAGRQAEIPPYRRAEIAAPGALGPDDLPLRYDETDPWDRRYLADALVIDAQIGPLLASLGERERETFLDAATLRRAMPGLPRGGGLDERLEEADDGAEALVLAAIAVSVEDRSFTTGWDAARSFRDDGAGWGLVALDQGARSSQVLPLLRDALDTVELGAARIEDAEAGGSATTEPAAADGAGSGTDGAAAGSDPAGGDQGGAGTDPTEGGTDSGGSGTDPGQPTTTVPEVSVPTLPETPDVGGTVGGVVDGATDGVDGVTSGVGEVVEGVVDGVDGVTSGVGDVVDDVVGGLGGIVGGLGGSGGGLGGSSGGTGGG